MNDTEMKGDKLITDIFYIIERDFLVDDKEIVIMALESILEGLNKIYGDSNE